MQFHFFHFLFISWFPFCLVKTVQLHSQLLFEAAIVTIVSATGRALEWPSKILLVTMGQLSQSYTVAKSGHFWQTTGQSNFTYEQLAAAKLPKFFYYYYYFYFYFTHATALCQIGTESSILSAKFDCPVACIIIA